MCSITPFDLDEIELEHVCSKEFSPHEMCEKCYDKWLDEKQMFFNETSNNN